MEIELCGYKVLIDDEDYEKVNMYRWHINNRTLKKSGLVYFENSYKDSRKKCHARILSRLIAGLNLYDGKICDHINGNTLDNRKENLRITTSEGNNRNSKKRKNNKSGYKGVYRPKNGKSFIAQIKANESFIYLGSYKTPELAYAAYCEASKKYHGEYGRVE